MFYHAELDFFIKIMEECGLPVHLTTESTFHKREYDLGLRSYLGLYKDLEHAFEHLLVHIPEKTVCKITDELFCSYLILRLPDCEEDTFLIVGPYVKAELTTQEVYQTIEKYHVSPQMTERIIQYFANITQLSGNSAVFSILNVFAEKLWGSAPDSYSHKEIFGHLSNEKLADITRFYQEDFTDQMDISFKMQLLEERYAFENRFIKNISLRNFHKVEAAFAGNTKLAIEPRLKDPIRNLKNYCIILNTLLRKGAEFGSVHPIHIDRISSIFAKKIEEIQTLEQGEQLLNEMVRKYGLLVKNYSTKEYSLLIQKTIARIDADVTADHSLSTYAKLLSVSPSYLSTLFRKETGMTLTEYVNRKRAEHGVFLLNTTAMQIQTIAQHCGISDVNYFTRIFKKYIGKTPKEYRNSIGS